MSEDPKAPPHVTVKPFPERVEQFLGLVGAGMDDYEKTEPLWEVHTLLDIVGGAIESLRHYLTNPTTPDAAEAVEILHEDELPPPLTNEALRNMGVQPEALERLAAEAGAEAGPLHHPDLNLEPSWAAPEVELQYAVEWDWKTDSMVSVTLKDEELGDKPETWSEDGGLFFMTHRNLFVLRLVTRHALVRHRENQFFRIIPEDLSKRFPSLLTGTFTPSATARWELDEAAATPPEDPAAVEALDARYRPFVLSPGTLGLVSSEFVRHLWEKLLKEGQIPPFPDGVTPEEAWWTYVPEDVKLRLVYESLDTSLGDPDLPPLFRLEGNHNGKTFTADLRLTVHALVVDEDERRAYFPIVVSLVFDGDADRPETWSEEDRAVLWAGFDTYLKTVRAEVDRLVPPKVPEDQRIGGSGGIDAGPPTVSGTGHVEASKADTLMVVDTARLALTETVDTVPPPVKVGKPAPERRTFPLAFGPTRGDANALALTRAIHKVRFPARRWATLPSWPELVEREKARIVDEDGDRAFTDIPGGRPALLKYRTVKGVAGVYLTEEAERNLKIREGLTTNGFRYVDPHNGLEYLTKLFTWRGGFLEVGFSWFGLAGPLVEEWRKDRQREAADVQENQQNTPFELLTPQQQTEVARRVKLARLLEDSHRLMECVLGAVGTFQSSSVAIPAEAFRELLGLKSDPHWRARLEGGLLALRAFEFRFKSFETATIKCYGSFLAAWQYHGAGAGAHGDGVYDLYVTPPFLGCLKAFETSRRQLDAGLNVSTFDFSKRLTEEQKAEHGWGYDRKAKTHRTASSHWVEFDAGRVFFDAKQELTPSQSALHAFVDEQITRRSHAVGRVFGNYHTRKAEQLNPTHADAKLPRLYDSSLCPVLPQGRRYCAALGNFKRGHGETGWLLYGTARREGNTGGAHKAGLLAQMGYALPVGGATRARAEIVKKALEDLKAVVVDYLEGAVVAFHSGQWLTLEAAAKLPDDDLGRRTRFFLFVPETFKADRVAKWEAAAGYRVTEDPKEAARAALGHHGDGLELRLRLRIARLERKLSQAAVGKLFAVAQAAVAYWELGTHPDETGKVRGKSIPEELVPLVERWVTDGTPPSGEELAARKTARTGVRKTDH